MKSEPKKAECRLLPADDAWIFYAALGAAVVILAVFAAPMLVGKLYTFDDLGNLALPMRSFYARCLKSGENFNWFPDIHCGFYLHGEGQAGMYHPLHVVLYRALPFTAAFNVELFLSYPVMLLGMFLFLRRRGLARSSAMFGAAVFTFSGFNLLHFMHMHAIAVIAHVPWLLLSLDVLLRGSARRSWALSAVVLLTASQVLLGFPQAVWFSVLVEAPYVFVFLPPGRRVRTLAALATAKMLGVLVGAVQLLATWDQLHNSFRLVGAAFKSGMYSLEGANVVQFVAPYLFRGRVMTTAADLNTHEYGIYNGAVSLLLVAVLAVVVGRLGPQRRLAVAALALCAAGFLFALGENGPLWPLMSRLPLVGMFRASARYIVLAHLGMAVGAAVAFDFLRRRSRDGARLHWPGLAALGVVVVGSLAAVALARTDRLARFAVENRLLVAAGPVIVAAGAALVAAAGRGLRWALVGLVIFAAADQAIYGLSYVYKKPPQTLASFAPKPGPPVDPRYYRVAVLPVYGNAFVLAGRRLSNGFVSFPPKKFLNYATISALRVAGVKWRIVDTAMAAGDRSQQGLKFNYYEVPDPMPRARLVSETVVALNFNEALESIDISQAAVVTEKVDVDAGPAGQAKITIDKPGDVTIAVSAPTRQFLVFAERFHEGWRASVDRKPARVARAYGDFMGCVVEPGEHEVRFLFRPKSLRLGGWLSLAGLALWAAFLFVYRRLDRRHATA